MPVEANSDTVYDKNLLAVKLMSVLYAMLRHLMTVHIYITLLFVSAFL